jgi:hypothetical protein
MATSPVPLTRTAFQDLKRLTFLLLYGMEDSPYRRATGFVQPAPDPADESVLDVRTPAPGEVIDADACVVGSGAGGGVAAAILAAAGKRVVVLERAANVTEREFGGPELEGLAKLFLDRGLTATDDRWFSIRAGSAVGGGTVVNWSSSLRLPDAVRDEWRAAGIDDLDPHYDAVEAETSVTTAESEHNGPNGALARGLDALGLPRQVIPRNVRGCTDCGPCAVGCRTGAKRSALRTYLAGSSCATGASRASWRPYPAGRSPSAPRGSPSRAGRSSRPCSCSGPASRPGSPAGRSGCTRSPPSRASTRSASTRGPASRSPS